MPREHHQEKQHGRRHLVETPTQPQNIEEKIRLRAYELYEQRQGEPGDPENDWYRAEAEVVRPEKEQHH